MNKIQCMTVFIQLKYKKKRTEINTKIRKIRKEMNTKNKKNK